MRSRLDGRLAWVASLFRAHGICLHWQAGDPLTAEILYVGGQRQPRLEDFAASASPGRPTLLLVPQLVTWDKQRRQHVTRSGATPGVGANLAAVRYRDQRGDGIVVRNELLHVLGLSDAELGVTHGDPRHIPRAPMWRFMHQVCRRSLAASGDKRSLIVQKEACLERTERSDSCYDLAPTD